MNASQVAKYIKSGQKPPGNIHDFSTLGSSYDCPFLWREEIISLPHWTFLLLYAIVPLIFFQYCFNGLINKAVKITDIKESTYVWEHHCWAAGRAARAAQGPWWARVPLAALSFPLFSSLFKSSLLPQRESEPSDLDLHLYSLYQAAESNSLESSEQIAKGPKVRVPDPHCAPHHALLWLLIVTETSRLGKTSKIIELTSSKLWILQLVRTVHKWLTMAQWAFLLAPHPSSFENPKL